MVNHHEKPPFGKIVVIVVPSILSKSKLTNQPFKGSRKLTIPKNGHKTQNIARQPGFLVFIDPSEGLSACKTNRRLKPLFFVVTSGLDRFGPYNWNHKWPEKQL